MLQAKRPPPSKKYEEPPAFQVIILQLVWRCPLTSSTQGSSGGPREDNVTGGLVRSLSTNWETNSVVAVDGGTLLGGIIRCLELSETKPAKFRDGKNEKDGVQMVNGAFEGLTLPHKAAESNGAWIFRHLIQTVLVTHAHLDHCSALAMNTPLIETETGPKVIGALPSVIAALKDYIFNDVIWPNLSDEDEGAGLITYQRLSDGGNPMLGRGTGRGYVESCSGIVTKAMSISHGKSKRKYNPDTDKFERLPQNKSRDTSSKDSTKMEEPEAGGDLWAAVDSSAFFLLDVRSGSEILLFGDLEPDCVSASPRNAKVWREAAKKLAAKSLRGIFVECSYPDAVDDATLFGHMCPRHLIAEMSEFARYVKEERKLLSSENRPDSGSKKTSPSEDDQNHQSDDGSPPLDNKRTSPSERCRGDADKKSPDDDSGRSASSHDKEDAVPVEKSQKSMGTEERTSSEDDQVSEVSDHPLKGLKVFIVHIKEELSLPKSAREKIMSQLNKHNEEVGLGCDFISLLAGEVAYL
ncbi:3',5'-cyclic-nucleotide phosphodiesterase pde1 [Ascosphaera aggregata]|nr:3',5'-cyclic-nucleotide phosphodiesterase pde1 [Ascosphaera aggregata]